MALTANNARALAYGLPLLAVAIAIGAAFRPAIRQAQQQTGNSEQSIQLNAIARDIVAQRCYTSPKAPIKGLPIKGIESRSLQSSCLYGEGWYGFIAVLGGQPVVIETFTQIQINAQLSQLKGK